MRQISALVAHEGVRNVSEKKTRRIGDFPHFQVSEMQQVESDCRNGPEYRLLGTVDRTSDVREGECYLLVSGEVLVPLFGDLKFLDTNAGTAEFYTSEESMPSITGLNLTYLESRYNPLHVFMVSEPRWKWSKAEFQAVDATYRRIERQDKSIVDGEEVEEWIEIKPIHGGSRSRLYPVFPSGRTTLPPPGDDGVIKAGWSHVHCELCESHIDAGRFGYVDLGKHWICEQCYSDYVVSHDLSFLE